jgi:transcriptional regulator with XRE-family HTH domain
MYGAKIASIRKSRSLSQENLAKMIGIEQNTLSDIENDKYQKKINEEMLAKIAKSLGVGVEDIKSPSPIIMNFTTNDNATAVGQQYNSFDEKLKEPLVVQLGKKDEQIDKLIALLGSKVG